VKKHVSDRPHVTDKLRFGLIGCGGIGAIRASALRRTPAADLVMVADADAARARAVAQQSGCEFTEEWRTLLERADIDAVVISTPPQLHTDMCIAALQAGKHVLCEKPLARNAMECQAILETAATVERVVATGFNYRFYPSMQKARELLDSGVIGELDHIRSYAGYSAVDHNPPWVHDGDVMGGGALRDNGIHLIDLTRWFLGEVVEVRGATTAAVWNFAGCEDNGFALLTGKSGRVASLQASWTEWRGYKFLIELYGTHGCIRASCFPMITEVAWSNARGGPFKRKRHLFPRVFLREHLRSYKALVEDSFVAEMSAFHKTLTGGASQIASGLDGMRAVEIAQAAAPGAGIAQSTYSALGV
jgi:predicted dehydrogenase